jgi:hypothetical protein
MMRLATLAHSLARAFARARHVPNVFAWACVMAVVVLAMGHVRWRQLHPSLELTRVTGRVLVRTGAQFEAEGRVYALRGVHAPARGTRAGECAAEALQGVLRQGNLGVIRVGVHADTVDVFAVVADSIPVNALLLWEGATDLGTLADPVHPLDRAIVLAANGGAAQQHPRCRRSS